MCFEGDAFENFLTNFSSTISQFSTTPNQRYGTSCSANFVSNHSLVYTASPDQTFYQSLHTYDMVWKPGTTTTNSGHFTVYVDGTQVADQAYTPLDGSEGAPPIGGTKTYGIQDGNAGYPAHYPVIFGAGFLTGGATTTGSSISGGNLLTVGTLTGGQILIGHILSGTGITANSCYIGALHTGSSGTGSGSTWDLSGVSGNNNPSTAGCPATAGPTAITLNGQPNSTQLQLHSLVVYQHDDSGNIRGN